MADAGPQKPRAAASVARRTLEMMKIVILAAILTASMASDVINLTDENFEEVTMVCCRIYVSKFYVRVIEFRRLLARMGISSSNCAIFAINDFGVSY